jgi:hypothetical protein
MAIRGSDPSASAAPRTNITPYITAPENHREHMSPIWRAPLYLSRYTDFDRGVMKGVMIYELG